MESVEQGHFSSSYLLTRNLVTEQLRPDSLLKSTMTKLPRVLGQLLFSNDTLFHLPNVAVDSNSSLREWLPRGLRVF